jgi:hypothetical protein
MKKNRVDPNLFQFCTVRQMEILQALDTNNSYKSAADALGISKGTVQTAMDSVRRKAAISGYSPEHDMKHIVPAPFVVKGHSTYYDKEGKPTQQWVKTKLDEQQRMQAIELAFASMAETLPKLPPLELANSDFNDDLLNLYTITDFHIGMLAWKQEAGADWDLKIAEQTLTKCFRQMVAGAPNARYAFINQLGDFLHSDGLLPVTPTSGHILDADGRFSKIVETALRVLRHLVDSALQQHEQVIVLMEEGNHDIVSSIWLRIMFKALYENDPRIKVIDSPLPYHAWQHGQTMLGFHHGHLSKNNGLPLIFAAQFSEMWGATKKRYVHTGHRHHVEEKEHSGITVVQHPTLAARDAYAARGGWLSERQATVITYHKKFGQVARNTVTPEMVQ